MTPKIIYKQRHIAENGRKFSPSRNAHYAQYIGYREHVLKKSPYEKNEENYNATRKHIANLVKYIGEREHAAKKSIDKIVIAEKDKLTVLDKEKSEEILSEEVVKYKERIKDERDNGLFGYIGNTFSDDYNIRDVRRYIRKMSENHNVFHSIFSFTPDSADEAGLHSLEDWQNWTKYHIRDIAEGMNMKTEDIEYIAAVHLKEGQPHVHIEWWNKEQQVLINKVNPLICDKIRVSAIQGTYRKQFNDLHNAEDAILRTMRDNISEKIQSILISTSDDYEKTIGKALNHIFDMLPNTGQLKYGYMETEIKEEINKLTHYVIDNNPQFSQLYSSILEQRRMYNEMLHSTGEGASDWSKYKLKKYSGKLNDDIERYIGNTILRIIKSDKIKGRKKLIEALDAAPIEDLSSEHWMKYPENKSFEPYIRWTERFKAARNAAKEGEYTTALESYEKEAEAGNVLAEYEIADLYRKGVIGSKDKANEHYQKALSGFMKAEKNAKKMKPYLQYRIGRMYFDGYGITRNAAEAARWLEKASDNGHNFAQIALAKLYLKGDGVMRDVDEGISMLTEVKQSDKKIAPIVDYTLGAFYLSDEKMQDKELAVKYLISSTKGGNNYAKVALAKLYLKGDGVPRDADKGISMLTEAKQSDKELAPTVDYTLGAFYLYDEKRQDKELAVKYLTLSTEGGNDYAQIALAKLYLKGDEVPRDADKGISMLTEVKQYNKKLAPMVDYTLGAFFLFDSERHNRDIALKLLNLSSQAGNQYAENLLYNYKVLQERSVVRLISDTAKILASCEQGSSDALSATARSVFGRGDLSREQIRELLLKLQDKENTAEM